MREIKEAASQRGWNYRLRRWLGDPTAFRIDGWTHSGLTWILETEATSDYHRGWTVLLGLRFPSLAGEVDLAVFPRDSDGRGSALLSPPLSPDVQAKVAAFSGTAASAAGFFRDAQALPSGFPAFDAAYQIMARPERVLQTPIDVALAERLLRWPADAIAPHSVLAWRDPFGLHFQARMPEPPNWASLAYFLSLAEDFSARLPAPAPSPSPRGILDRIVARFLRS
jgi:hypothetical protein